MITFVPLSLPAVQAKKVTAAFDGGRLTSNGGVMLWRWPSGVSAWRQFGPETRCPAGRPDLWNGLERISDWRNMNTSAVKIAPQFAWRHQQLVQCRTVTPCVCNASMMLSKISATPIAETKKPTYSGDLIDAPCAEFVGKVFTRVCQTQVGDDHRRENSHDERHERSQLR